MSFHSQFNLAAIFRDNYFQEFDYLELFIGFIILKANTILKSSILESVVYFCFSCALIWLSLQENRSDKWDAQILNL